MPVKDFITLGRGLCAGHGGVWSCGSEAPFILKRGGIWMPAVSFTLKPSYLWISGPIIS